jgi:ADP-ribose pyrophosphatase YjhB (NUDIX family)
MGALDEWRFCPRCDAPIRPGSGRADCPVCGFAAYANPVPAACAICVDAEGRVLLARRAREPSKGLWDLPGGFLDEGEEPLEALVRELSEETGLEIEPARLLGIWSDWYGDGPGARSTLVLVWVARVVSGRQNPADDVSELRWFAPDELPPEHELAFPNVAAALAAWQEKT